MADNEVKLATMYTVKNIPNFIKQKSVNLRKLFSMKGDGCIHIYLETA